MKRTSSQQTISSFFKRPNTKRDESDDQQVLDEHGEHDALVDGTPLRALTVESAAESAKRLTGFALNISSVYNNKYRQRVRIFSVENILSNDAIFIYECFHAIPGVNYRATIHSLPTNLLNIDVQTVSINCDSPDVQRKTHWTASMDVSPLSNGSILVYFMPAPVNFSFSGYRVGLTTTSLKCNRCSNWFPLASPPCPEQGQKVLNPADLGLDVRIGFSVCMQPAKCGSCFITLYDMGPIVPISLTEETAKLPIVPISLTEETAKLNGTVMTTTLNPDRALPVGAIYSFYSSSWSNLLILLIGMVLLVLFLSALIHRTRNNCTKKDVNEKKKQVFLIYGDDVKLYSAHIIARLSAFIELCNNCEVISGDDCRSMRDLESRIDLADSVLIIRSAYATSRETVNAEGNNESTDSETTPIGDAFDSAIKIIKRNFQTEVSYMKFCQIILPHSHGGKADIGLVELKVKKTYQLMEFIEELWGNNQTMSSTLDSIADDLRKCCDIFKNLDRPADSTDCCLNKCSGCGNETCQYHSQLTVNKQCSNDSGITVDDLEDCFFFGSENSSSDAISLSSFVSKALKLNVEFDRGVEADALNNDRVIRIY